MTSWTTSERMLLNSSEIRLGSIEWKEFSNKFMQRESFTLGTYQVHVDMLYSVVEIAPAEKVI